MAINIIMVAMEITALIITRGRRILMRKRGRMCIIIHIRLCSADFQSVGDRVW